MRPTLLDRGRLLTRAVRIRLGQPRPAPRAVVEVPGPDPLRVLVVGAGLVAGYGETEQERALPGALARAVAGATGRGVAVDVHVGATLSSAGAADRVGRLEGRWDAVVFAPCVVEALLPGGSGMPRHAPDVVQRLLGAAGEDGRAVLLCLPCPARFSRTDLVAVRAVAEANRTLRAQQGDRVAAVDPPDIGSWSDDRPFGHDYYAELAGRVVAELVDRVRA